MCTISTGWEAVGSLEVAGVCGFAGFEYCCMSLASSVDASTASFVCCVSSSFCGDEIDVTQVAGLFDSESQCAVLVGVMWCAVAKSLTATSFLDDTLSFN